MKNKKIIFIVLVLAVIVVGGFIILAPPPVPVPAPVETPQMPELLPKLTIVGPPGPLSIPLAYIVENDKLSDIAEETELVIYKNFDQLRAIIAGGEGDFVIMPSNLAAIFYNKGMDVQLLDISVWSALHIISFDSTVDAIGDLKGGRIAMPHGEGTLPDILLRYISEGQGIDIARDLEVFYAANPAHAARMLIEGKVDHALLPEPLATIALLRGEGRLHRVIDISTEWENVVGGGIRTPIAGAVALPTVQGNPEVIKAFQSEFKLAIEWMLEKPDEAGLLAEEKLGFKAKAVAQSIANIEWDFVTARDARDDLEIFFGIMYEFSPESIGGRLPDDGFYHEGF
ncbi:ABC transporter substrate-binding protein [Thermodesulfovibrionales bacterium]|nr:ABC transporter substrate-binding protein [Thermodesulfovibrionales bacterium]